jgi:hypothetical protein
VASERRTCEKSHCHRRFSRPLGSRRRYCEECSPPRKPRAGDAPAPEPEGVGQIEARVLAELQMAERAATVEGLIALSVARDLDSGKVAPAQKPSVGQKLAVLLAAALEGTRRPEPDRLDELSEARARRAASA